MACGDIAKTGSEAGARRFGAFTPSLRRSRVWPRRFVASSLPPQRHLAAYELLRASQRRCDSLRAMSRPTGFYIGREWSVREKEIER